MGNLYFRYVQCSSCMEGMGEPCLQYNDFFYKAEQCILQSCSWVLLEFSCLNEKRCTYLIPQAERLTT